MTIPVILNLLLIQFIVVNIVDISGVMDSIRNGLSKWLNIKITKPLPLIGCSYCTNWWLSLIYLLCIGNLTLPYIAVVLTLSALTGVTKDLMYLLSDICTTLINLLNRLITKLQ